MTEEEENKLFTWKIQNKTIQNKSYTQSSTRDQWPKLITSIKRKQKENRKKKDKKHIFCFFMIWNLINVRKHKYGRIVPSVHEFILLSANSRCHFRITFMYIALYFLTSFSILYFSCFPFFSINHNQKHVLWILWSYPNVVSTLVNIENDNIVSTLSCVVNINVEMKIANIGDLLS